MTSGEERLQLFYAVDAVHARHAQVEQHDVRTPALDQRQDFDTRARLADDVDVVAGFQRLAQPLKDQGMIVGDQHLQDRLHYRNIDSRSRKLKQMAPVQPVGRCVAAVRNDGARGSGRVARGGQSWPCVSPAAAGGRDSSASEVIVSDPRAEDSSTSVASSSERA